MTHNSLKNNRRQFLLQSAVISAALAHPGLRAIANDKNAGIQNKFLEGNFAPMREEHTHENLHVIGQLPKDLQGMLVRNGPNPQFDPLGNYHWFDGDGMLHGVSIRDGKASYRNRFVQTDGFKQERIAGKPLSKGILEMPDVSKIAQGKNPYKNPSNTSVVFHAKKLLSLWEAGEPYELDLSLDTKGPMNFGGKLEHPFTAHPKIDPATGEMLTFGYIPSQPLLAFSTIDASGDWIQTTRIKLPMPMMVHDFAITENYVVFPLCPQTFDMSRLIQGKTPWYFNEKQPTRFAVVSRKNPKQAKLFKAETCFMFHIMNAFEKGAEIEIIGCRYDRFPGSLSFGDADDASADDRSVLYRWRLDIENESTKEGAVEQNASEFPRINDSFLGKENRFGYVGIGDGDFFNGLRKYDLLKGDFTELVCGQGRSCGEGVFVKRPGGVIEDDGWLLTFVFDSAESRSELWVMDARDLTQQVVAKIQLPSRVPYGFHGIWIDQV